ncbi:MAG: prolyl oligopeptidase family serine peptidase, partial [Candidatus Eisenbacteria bacterium]|nr:prolyl oligopeptidase family serine peptidase [Candidatus Eisenbacteria bacterium]
MASRLAPGGWAKWTRVDGEGPTVKMEFAGVDWDGATGQWGFAGILSGALAWGELDVPSSGRFLVDATRAGTLYVDGRRYLGNPYSIGTFQAPIQLAAGRHTVLLRIGGAGPREASFRLIPQEHGAALLAAGATVPDLVVGEPLDSWGAVTVVNLSGEELRGAVLRFGDGVLLESVEAAVPVLPPEGMLKVPFRVRSLRPVTESDRSAGGSGARTILRLTLADRELFAACSLRVRSPRESRRVTFLSSIDGSVQKYAALPPSVESSAEPSGDPSADPSAGPFALLLSLHGASVEPEPQVDSYSPKAWAYVVAPTNTGPYGFDWQDWGRRNAIETLENVLARFPIDPDRVMLVGHSMGGHGTWHVGLSDPGRFAALAPSAGWGSLGTYTPFTLREDVLAGDPRLRVLWERAIAPDNTLAFLGNARGLPVFVLHGGADDNVPVFHGRMLARRAAAAGARVVYREVSGQGHWWDASDAPGVDCVDLPEMMEFLRAQRRDTAPDTITLATADVGTCDRSHWLRIVEGDRPFSRVEVSARRTTG